MGQDLPQIGELVGRRGTDRYGYVTAILGRNVFVDTSLLRLVDERWPLEDVVCSILPGLPPDNGADRQIRAADQPRRRRRTLSMLIAHKRGGKRK